MRSPHPRGEKFGTALTERQRQVMELYGQGLSLTEIAARLGLHLSTVFQHRNYALAKAVRLQIQRAELHGRSEEQTT